MAKKPKAKSKPKKPEMHTRALDYIKGPDFKTNVVDGFGFSQFEPSNGATRWNLVPYIERTRLAKEEIDFEVSEDGLTLKQVGASRQTHDFEKEQVAELRMTDELALKLAHLMILQLVADDPERIELFQGSIADGIEKSKA